MMAFVLVMDDDPDLVPRLRARAPARLTAPRSREEERRRQAEQLAHPAPSVRLDFSPDRRYNTYKIRVH